MRRIRQAIRFHDVYVEVCFCCGCLVLRDSPWHIGVRWGAEDLGRDETTAGKRWTRARICSSCRNDLRGSGRVVTRRGEVEIVLSLIDACEKWCTHNDRVVLAEGVRRKRG